MLRQLTRSSSLGPQNGGSRDKGVIHQRIGDRLRPTAWCGPHRMEQTWSEFRIPVVPGTFAGRAVLERRTVYVDDIDAMGP